MHWLEELVPGFKDQIPEKRVETAAELSLHPRAKENRFVLAICFLLGFTDGE